VTARGANCVFLARKELSIQQTTSITFALLEDISFLSTLTLKCGQTGSARFMTGHGNIPAVRFSLY